MQMLDNTLFLSLGELLKSNVVDNKIVSTAMELIRTHCSFEYGVLYEMDKKRDFLLENQVPICEQNGYPFVIEEYVITTIQNEFPQKEIMYIQNNNQNTRWERDLLSKFAAKTLVLVPILDMHQNVFGILLFYNTKEGWDDQQFDTNLFEMAVYLLVHYVSPRMYEKRVERNRKAIEQILNNTGIDIYVNDFYNHDILYVNKSMAEPYGGREAFHNKKCWEVLFIGQQGPCEFCPARNLIDEDGNPTKVYSWDYQRSFDGEWFRVFSSAFCWEDGRLAHVVSSANITDNKQKEALIENLANYDQLTKLPNRRRLVQDCEKRINQATELEKGYVLFFDIDEFKQINDTLGHDAGDEFLIQLGEFFATNPVLKDCVYRNGGDEFVALIGGEGFTKANIQNLASFIHARFKKPWNLKKGSVYCNTSIGVSCYPEDGTTTDVLLQKADQAMYFVKKNGGGKIKFFYQLVEELDSEKDM